MSAITKAIFAPSPMDAMSLEAKGSKGDKGSKGSRESGGGKGKGPKNEPKKPFMIKGPIPPKEFRDPDIIYAETNPPGLPPGQRPYDKQKNDFESEQSRAVKTVMSWKDPSIYNAYAEKARGSSSSGKSGFVTYDGCKTVAVGSSSDSGCKSTAVYSTGSSTSSCSIS